ncbi:hypothetical protein POX_a00232 [Penicillium oxalicum]|uniref:Uncharacterized protein n=1 Tax=Penicillium oxalicum (strain 114-2 / CGMCC 5302) TaxID=933388 RepID=S8A0Z3_PENO1|nr:hypothetical protein POX_a00232 [Penicillium oxalicum]EPS34801.1 hypothetical protein PDE_09765 [Penicillium oxalicum 114-2]KAI2793649.1 hypothetical protein POX_a00232 [Penicillium oxalicum]
MAKSQLRRSMYQADGVGSDGSIEA